MKLSIGQARAIVKELDGSIRGWSASDYKDSINTDSFLVLEGDEVSINWDRIDIFADEVAARAIMEYANNKRS